MTEKKKTTKTAKILWVIDTGFAYGGILFDNDGRVCHTAPIFRKWFIKKWPHEVRKICKDRGWRIMDQILCGKEVLIEETD